MSGKPARRRRIRPPSWSFSDQWADENDDHSMPYVEGDCSKSRSGRNPQLGRQRLFIGNYCSKSRSGRNPQPSRLYRRAVLHCSKSRSGRNPQPPLRWLWSDWHCSKSRSGRNPQRLVRPAGCQSDLESINSACKPRAAATISSSISCSPASSISSRSLDARIWVPRNVV